jgi:uncharacterized protein
MRSVFADTGYWIAVVNPRDGLHDKAITVGKQLGPSTIITSDMVLTEVLNMLAESGAQLRDVAVKAVQAIKADNRIEVVPHTLGYSKRPLICIPSGLTRSGASLIAHRS